MHHEYNTFGITLLNKLISSFKKQSLEKKQTFRKCHTFTHAEFKWKLYLQCVWLSHHTSHIEMSLQTMTWKSINNHSILKDNFIHSLHPKLHPIHYIVGPMGSGQKQCTKYGIECHLGHRYTLHDQKYVDTYLSNISLCRQSGIFMALLFLIKTRREAFNLSQSQTLNQEILYVQ